MGEAPGKPPFREVSELTIRELIGRLRPSELYGVLAALVTLLSGAAYGGWAVRGYIKPKSGITELELVTAAEPGNTFQQRLRSRPAIGAFETFLDDAATERWADAYSLLATGWKTKFKSPEDLALEYRMTQHHEFNYYVPTYVTDTREEYNVDFTFWDYLPQLPFREGLTRSRIGRILKDSDVASLVEEIKGELPRDYKTNSLTPNELRSRIRDFVTGSMTLRDLVMRDDIIEELGKDLQLTPIIASETYQGKMPPTPKRRYFKVTLVKEEGQWRVESYDSFMVEKR